MQNGNLIKTIYSEQFEELKELAREVDALKTLFEGVQDNAVRKKLHGQIQTLENKLKAYAESMHLKSARLFHEVV